MERIVWKWKANVDKFIGNPDVVGIYIQADYPFEYQCLVGRSGYVGFVETISDFVQKEPDEV